MLAGVTLNKGKPSQGVCYLSTTTGDEELRRLWEVEDYDLNHLVLSPPKKAVVKHFRECHARDTPGRFIVPLLIKLDAPLLRDSTFRQSGGSGH